MQLQMTKTHASNNKPLSFILGPCVIESRAATLESAHFLTELAREKGFTLIFKGSFDKANRSSIHGFRGVGKEQGLSILEAIAQQYNVSVITDIHEPGMAAEVASVVDVLQIPAFLARQTDLLVAAGKTGKTINVKKGQFMTVAQAGAAVEKIRALTGNTDVWLCERGYTFGYENLIVDYRNFSQLKTYGVPVVFDATHSVQLPGAGAKGSSGGQRQFVADLAAAAVTQRISTLFMEVHPDPDNALCDGPNSVHWSDLPMLIEYLMALDSFVKTHPQIHTQGPQEESFETLAAQTSAAQGSHR